LEAAPTQTGIQVVTPAADLAQPVVRAIQQMGREKARGERPQAQQGE
jgi:hypothetical protein